MAGIKQSELDRIDKSIKMQLDLLRHSSNVEAKILLVIEEMRKELIAKLSVGDLTVFGKARINKILADADVTIADYYARAQKMLEPTYASVASISAASTSTGIASATPSKSVLKSIVSNVIIEGATTAAWWSKLSSDTSFKFAAAVRQGIAQGETQRQILKRVNDAVDLSGRNSAALIHTSIMQVMNDANLAVIKDNADVAPTMRHLATLDSHTCLECAPRDGLEWETETEKPIGHDLPFENPPLHFGCRCRVNPVTELDKYIEGERASTFGPVDRKVTFEDFLGRQSDEFQDEVLGKGRADLWRDKKLTLRDLVSGRGSPLTLDQLNTKYAI